MKKADSIHLPRAKFSLNASIAKGYWFVYLSFIISFVLCSVIAILCEDTFIEICSFVIVFVGAFIINAYQIHREMEINNAFDKRFEISQEVISHLALAVLVFDSKGKIVSVDISKKLMLPGNLKDYLDKISAALLIPYQVQKEIRNIVFSNASNVEQRNFGSYEYDGKFFDLNLIRLNGADDYTVISLVYSNNKPSEDKKRLKDAFIGFYELDGEMHLVNINSYFAKILGYKKEELLSGHRNIDKLIGLDGIVTRDKKQLHGTWQGFLTFTTKYNEKVNCFVMQKAVLDQAGKIERIIGYVAKLSNPSLMLEAEGLERNWIGHSWKSFFEESPYPVAMLDNNGIVIKANQAFNGMATANLLNKKLTNVFDAAGEEVVVNEIKKLITNNKPTQPLKGISCKNGGRKLDVYLSGIKDVDDNNIGFIVRVNDSTHQMELEESLSHAQRMQTIGQLVGAVAHDFNNLLTAITGFCDILLLRHAVGDPSFVNIIQIKQSADRASNLVKRLLAFSRKQTLKLEAIKLSEFFSDISTLIQRLVGAEVVVKKEIDQNLCLVKFDPVQLEQVVLNLIVNAQQAMVHGGVVNIKINNVSLYDNSLLMKEYVAPPGEQFPPLGDYVSLEFTDNGKGIPNDIIQRIFEPFFTTKADKSGTGLGLATVYGIVRQSEGYIYVKSKEGKGTTFLILLKKYNISEKEFAELKEEQEKKISSLTDNNKANLSGKGIIALVEDEEAVRLFAKSALVIKGYEVMEFASAKIALEQIRNNLPKIDLIVSDVMMPEMSGPEFISEIHKIYPNLKVVFISGFGEDAFTEEYGNKRDFNFLPKPFTLKQLVSKVKEVMMQND